MVKMSADGTSLVYSTYLGGSSLDVGYGIAVDTAGNAYVTGRTDSANFSTTPGAFDTSHDGGLDAFVVKMSADGTSLGYGTYLGGEVAYDIAVDAAGNAYVMGWTASTDSGCYPTHTRGARRGSAVGFHGVDSSGRRPDNFAFEAKNEAPDQITRSGSGSS